MIPSLEQEQYRRRLALPFKDALVPPPFIMGVNVRMPLMKSIKLQPMPTSGIPVEEVSQTKGYFLGGLFPDQDEVMERLRKQQEEARKPSRITAFMNENPDFANALLGSFRDYYRR